MAKRNAWVGRNAVSVIPPWERRDWHWLRTVWLPTRKISFYWLGLAMKTACAPEGEGRKRDREAFEAEWVHTE